MGGSIRNVGDVCMCAGRLRPDNPYLLLDEGGETGLAAEADLTTEVRGRRFQASTQVLWVRKWLLLGDLRREQLRSA